MDPVLLSRLQFAITIGFHFFFPPITIGLAWLLVVVEWKAWKTGEETWKRIGRTFAKMLGMTFAVGVASGIVMEFQFGTNWAAYSRFVGDIFGAPLAVEAVFTFFLESTFIGLYLFAGNRIGPKGRWFSILMVAVGATLSAFWILVANSWQQTPAGYEVVGGRAVLTDFAAAVFNPSMWQRFTHTLTAALASGAFFMVGIAAYWRLRGKSVDVAERTLKLSVPWALVTAMLVLFPTGHESAKQVAHTQPEKFAAIEGLYETTSHAPLVVFGVPHEDPPDLKAPVQIPSMLSWMAFGDAAAEVKGIDAFKPDEVPPLALTFISFHTMVGLGMMMILLTGLATLQLYRRRLFDARRLLRLLIWAIPVPLLACQIGWITAEVGRQPWIVYHELKTADAISVTVSAAEILASLIMFSLIYLCLGTLYVWLLVRKIKRGPLPVAGKEVG